MALPGLNTTAVKRAGRVLLYVYAWPGRGAPQLGRYEGATRAEADAAMHADAAGLAGRYADAMGRTPPDARFMSGLIVRFKDEVVSGRIYLADSTRTLWFRYLDDIGDTFGTTSLRALQAKGARALIRDWYHGMRDTPGKADVCLSILSRLFTFAVDLELMDRNPAARIPRLPRAANRSAMIWTRAAFDRLLAGCAEPQRNALELAWATGLRRSDLVALRWADIDRAEGVIIIETKKSRKHNKRRAVIPIDAAVDAALARFQQTGPLVVTNRFGRPYKNEASFGKGIEKVIRAGGFSPLTFHDIRGTYVTRLFTDGTSDEDAEYIMGWSPGQGSKMRPIYGDPDSIGKAAAKRLKRKRAS